MTGGTGSFSSVLSASDLVYNGTTSLTSTLATKLTIPSGSFILTYSPPLSSGSTALLVTHSTAMQFAITGFFPPTTDTIQMSIDSYGVVCQNLSVTTTLNCTLAATFADTLSCKALTTNGDVTLGIASQTNTLKFNGGGANYNRIVSTASNQISLYANNQNVWVADGTTFNIYSDISCYSNTASAVKRLTVESAGTGGTPYITLKSRGTTTASLSLTPSSLNVTSESSGVPITFQTNNGVNVISPLSIYSTGVLSVGNNAVVNKQLVLYDLTPSESIATGTAFYGFGVNTNTLRAQVASTSGTFKFYCGTTIAYTINSAGGANGSDSRWKTEVQNITGALATISQLQGKTFVLNGGEKDKWASLPKRLRRYVQKWYS